MSQHAIVFSCKCKTKLKQFKKYIQTTSQLKKPMEKASREMSKIISLIISNRVSITIVKFGCQNVASILPLNVLRLNSISTNVLVMFECLNE